MNYYHHQLVFHIFGPGRSFKMTLCLLLLSWALQSFPLNILPHNNLSCLCPSFLAVSKSPWDFLNGKNLCNDNEVTIGRPRDRDWSPEKLTMRLEGLEFWPARPLERRGRLEIKFNHTANDLINHAYTIRPK